MNDASLAMTPTHGIRIRRLRLHSPDRSYDIDFRTPHGTPRALAVIAGAFSTGKTTILEFVDYCLDASRHPQHPEITPKVRAVTLEVELSGRPHLIERAVGTPSTFASVRAGRMDTDDGTPAERRPLRPAHTQVYSNMCSNRRARYCMPTSTPSMRPSSSVTTRGCVAVR